MEYFHNFLEWVWARHHNVLSWYVRPLFILPFCYFAYRRSWRGLILTVAIFPTSLFWFPAPERPDPAVIEYLAWEREFATGDNVAAKLALVLLVVAFFGGLGAAFGKRSWRYGLFVLNAGTLLKVVWSVALGGQRGWASLLPSVVTLTICNAFIIAAVKLRARTQIQQKPAGPSSQDR